MIQKGALLLLSVIFSGLAAMMAWGGSTIMENVKFIESLKEKDISRKELILRIDKKVDNLDNKLDKVLEALR